MADKIPDYKVGDVVGVPIEKPNQLKNGERFLPAIIYKVSFGQGQHHRYHVCCAHGAITRSFHGREIRNFAGIGFQELKGVDHALVNDATARVTVKEAVVLNEKKLWDTIAGMFIIICWPTCNANIHLSKKENNHSTEECDHHSNADFTSTSTTTGHIGKPTPRSHQQTRNVKPVPTRRITRALTRMETRSRTHRRHTPY